jgi:endonuclease YncB( thermonuclease family)
MTKPIRIAGFDAPETFRPKSEAERQHGLEATEFAKKLLVGELKLISCGYGVYNRVEGYIILEDGRNFTQIMIDNGFQKHDNYETYKF